MKRVLPLLMLSTLAAGHALPARAAESYDNCTGFITSLPATISTQGVWCMDRDLATAITSGPAVLVATNNVTLDCNGFKLGGLSAGTASTAWGVQSQDRLNFSLRNCNIRGFGLGVVSTGSGSLIEDNLFDGNLSGGVSVTGAQHVIRRNRILDTGGSTALRNTARGISVDGSVDILDNLIDGISPLADVEGGKSAHGIFVMFAAGSRIEGNTVRGITESVADVQSHAVQVAFVGTRNEVVRNHLAGPFDYGITCPNADNYAIDNLVAGATVAAVSICTASGNRP